MVANPYAASNPSAEDHHRATVAAGFVAGLLSGALAPGHEPTALLARAGLRPEHLTGPARTPINDYATLYNTVVEALADEAFGLLPDPLRPGSFEFLCRGTIGASTLGEALDRGGRFLAVVLPDLGVRVEADGAVARLLIEEKRRLQRRANDPRRVFAFEWLLRLLHGLACWLAGRSLTLDSVAFPYHAPSHASEYARIYTAHSTFGSATLVAALDARLLSLPVRRNESDLAAFLEGSPGKISMLYRRDREVALAVRAAMAGALAESPGIDAIARGLDLSARTLHRRLAEEGTSYRAIREALRREQALLRLEKTGKSIAEIATDLGYSEPSAFFRAFVGWTGMAPTLYRKHNTPGDGGRPRG